MAKCARHASQVSKRQETSVRQASKSICIRRKSKYLPHRAIAVIVRSRGGAKMQGQALCLALDGPLHHRCQRMCVHTSTVMIVDLG
jgi:hypothetical protein